jgi:hypothetical protein
MPADLRDLAALDTAPASTRLVGNDLRIIFKAARVGNLEQLLTALTLLT